MARSQSENKGSTRSGKKDARDLETRLRLLSPYPARFSHSFPTSLHILHITILEPGTSYIHTEKLSWLRRYDMKKLQFQTSVSSKFDEYYRFCFSKTTWLLSFPLLVKMRSHQMFQRSYINNSQKTWTRDEHVRGTWLLKWPWLTYS